MIDIILVAAATIFGLTLGATFPDIDLAPPLPLKHRSAWTHGPFIAVALSWAIAWHPLLFWFALGATPALCLHLFKDMFPHKWHGGALIKLYPLPITLPAMLSFIYLALGVYWSGRLFVDLFLSLNLI